MGFGDPEGAAASTTALASLVEIRPGLPATVMLALQEREREDVRA